MIMIGWLLLGLIALALGLVFLLFPRSIVRLQGAFYRRIYKDTLELSDKEIDRIPMLPTDRYYMGRRSDFVKNATTDPDMMPRLLNALRMLGCVWVFLVVVAIVLGFLIYRANLLLGGL